jgi:hypothetical protein
MVYTGCENRPECVVVIKVECHSVMQWDTNIQSECMVWKEHGWSEGKLPSDDNMDKFGQDCALVLTYLLHGADAILSS